MTVLFEFDCGAFGHFILLFLPASFSLFLLLSSPSFSTFLFAVHPEFYKFVFDLLRQNQQMDKRTIPSEMFQALMNVMLAPQYSQHVQNFCAFLTALEQREGEGKVRMTVDHWMSFLEFCKAVHPTTLAGYEADSACMCLTAVLVLSLVRFFSPAISLYCYSPILSFSSFLPGPTLFDEYVTFRKTGKLPPPARKA